MSRNKVRLPHAPLPTAGGRGSSSQGTLKKGARKKKDETVRHRLGTVAKGEVRRRKASRGLQQPFHPMMASTSHFPHPVDSPASLPSHVSSCSLRRFSPSLARCFTLFLCWAGLQNHTPPEEGTYCIYEPEVQYMTRQSSKFCTPER
jgi:hypothetical protein